MSYDVFMIDPPWPKKKGGLRAARPNQGRLLDYSTMSVDGIFTLLDDDIFPQALQCHCVFLWTVDQFLLSAERNMESRGYKRHARLVWDKGNGVAPAFTIRYVHEYLLWFYKPKLLVVDANQRGKLTTIIRERARQHSRKPDAAYTLVETLYPQTHRLDVFSREPRDGWHQYGDQMDFYAAKIGEL